LWGISKTRQAAMTAFPARLTDAEWAVLQPLVPALRGGGRPPKYTRRAILDAIVSVVRQGVT
jgi:transposase